jgi:ATP-dependent helicase HrpB
LIGERDVLASDLFKGAGPGRDRGREAMATGPSDLLHRMDLFEEAAAANFASHKLRGMNLDPAAVMSANRVRRSLLRAYAGLRGKGAGAGGAKAGDEALLISILAGYPDRVAKRRAMKADNQELLLSGGGAATLSRSSVVDRSEFVVAIDAEERRDATQARARVVRVASRIEPDWLIDLFSDRIREAVEAKWNAQAERVEIVERLMYDQLAISETRVNTPASAAGAGEAARVLADAALSAGIHRFIDPETVANFLARVEFVARTFPESSTPILTDEDARRALAALCAESSGRKSFAELREAAKAGGLLEELRRRLDPDQRRLLDRMAPETTALGRRRHVRINYETGKAPWIESRLQDFFGMKSGPSIAGGRVPIVLRLLAPNHRPVQITTDLAGFWLRTYPQVRKELSRRYPRHAWPENPLLTDEK